MRKTEVPYIETPSKGILISVSEKSDYEMQRARLLAEKRQTDRINKLEEEVSSIHDILKEILKKVS